MPANTPQPEAFTDEWFDAEDARDGRLHDDADPSVVEREERRDATHNDSRDADADFARRVVHRGTRAQSIGTVLDTTSGTTRALERGEKDMPARFPGPCKRCDARINEGDRIAYIRGKGARHYPVCPGDPIKTVVSRVRMMTPGQAGLITDLQVERGVPHNSLDDTTFAEASTLIADLIKMPRVSRKKRTVELNGLPEGRYAVKTEEGHLAFYNVTERGVFLQLSDALHAVPAAVEQAVIAKILLDPAEAARTYGREIGNCWCGRTLTNETSREYGIGPICRKNMGW